MPLIAGSEFAKPTWRSKPSSSPYIPEIIAVPYVALTIWAMIFMGTPNIMIFYALWLPISIYKKNSIFTDFDGAIFPFVLALFSLLSCVWSDYRSVSMRAGAEFVSTMFCIYVIVRTVKFHSFLYGILLGSFLALTFVVATSGLHSDESLTGSLGSKNQVGMIAEICSFCAIIAFFAQRNWLAHLIFSLIPFSFALLALYFSHSTTSNVTLVGTFALLIMMQVIAKFPKFARIPLLLAGFSLIAAVVITSSQFGAQESGLRMLGKDTTLTGRTYLWGIGLHVGMQHPILGAGYDAFWVKGRPMAEAIWYEFQIATRSGFHFHDLFVNTFVELGIIGVLLWFVFYAAAFIRSCRAGLKYGMTAQLAMFMGIVFMYTIRSIVEVDTPGPYGIGAVLFFTSAIQMSRVQQWIGIPEKKLLDGNLSASSADKSMRRIVGS